MIKLYKQNGLVVRTQEEIKQRQRFVEAIVDELQQKLLLINHSFSFQQCEVSIITPNNLINKGYTSEDVYTLDEELTLRPETTMGSYEYAKYILDTHYKPKTRVPVVVWQHGKSFRKEQDKTISHMRLKEFYQLEFQIIYSDTTEDDYHTKIVEIVKNILGRYFPVQTIPSDRLPDYSDKTTDIEINGEYNMELCSISQRKDFSIGDQAYKVVEVAIGTDRLLYNYCN